MNERTMVLWCPDWPVRAAVRAVPEPVGAGSPVALFDHGEIYACSAAARAEGVRRGLRMRDAQARCPELMVLPYDAALDAREFEPVLAAVEEVSPGVQPLRPGTCALRARGPARYYGGERAAAAVLAERLVGLGVTDCRLGIADGPFTAEQAARRAEEQDSVVVGKGESAQFLAPLGVGVLERPALVGLLQRLGLRTLGDFARLSARDVLARFGPAGSYAHRLASGYDAGAVAARRPPPELERHIDFEPPLTEADPVAFSVRRTAENFVQDLLDRQLVCTSVWVEVHTEKQQISSRQWLHPRWFDAADLVDRVRWQVGGEVVQGPGAPVCRVRLVPETVAPLADHAEGLWGGGPDERVHRTMSRVQSMLGHQAVVSATVHGGRSPRDRQRLVPWGDKPTGGRPPDRPWPGSLPPPAPATVFGEPQPAVVVGPSGRPVGVTARGAVTDVPTRFAACRTVALTPVQAWAGPWPVDERWWDSDSRRAARFQVVGVDGSAWLLTVENGRWWAEARYD